MHTISPHAGFLQCQMPSALLPCKTALSPSSALAPTQALASASAFSSAFLTTFS